MRTFTNICEHLRTESFSSRKSFLCIEQNIFFNTEPFLTKNHFLNENNFFLIKIFFCANKSCFKARTTRTSGLRGYSRETGCDWFRKWFSWLKCWNDEEFCFRFVLLINHSWRDNIIAMLHQLNVRLCRRQKFCAEALKRESPPPQTARRIYESMP